jgi:acetyl-CoA carboxylase alpha subunit
VVIGEGGSGGALAIGCSNWNLIMEHSVYYVASPEACAAILWKSRDKAATVIACQSMYLGKADFCPHGCSSCLDRPPNMS